MFKMFKLIHPEKEFAKKFEIVLIRENSGRLQLLFGFVGISQIIFILSEAAGVLPWQTDIFIYRLLVIGFCALFIGLTQYANRIDSSGRSIIILRVTTSRRSTIIDDDRLLFCRIYVQHRYIQFQCFFSRRLYCFIDLYA